MGKVCGKMSQRGEQKETCEHGAPCLPRLCKLELIYFDGFGRAELARSTFRAGSVKFTDTRLKMPEWSTMKNDPTSLPSQCFGSLPMLAHGDQLVAQSMAVAQYAADLGLYKRKPPTIRQRALDMMVLGAHAEMQRTMFVCHFGDEASQKAGKAELFDKVGPVLAGLERMYAGVMGRESDGPFLYTSTADGPMLGDLAVADAVTSSFPGLQALGVCMAPYPKLMACVNACLVSGMSQRSSGRDGASAANVGALSVRVLAAYNLKNTDSGILGDLSDPFVTVQVDKVKFKTSTKYNNLNPVWNSDVFNFAADTDGDACCADAPHEGKLTLEVSNMNKFHSATTLGKLAVEVKTLPPGQWVHRREALSAGEGDLEYEVLWQPGVIAGKVELIGFDEHCRVELARTTLRAGGIPFADTRVKSADWHNMKYDRMQAPARCFGALPVLNHGGHLLAQSIAVVQYAADLGLYARRPPTTMERATDMMVLGAYEDLQRAMFACDNDCQELKQVAMEVLPSKVSPLLQGLERMYAARAGPFLYTSQEEGPMPGDLAVSDAVASPWPGLRTLGVELSRYPNLLACVAACEAHMGSIP